MRLSVRRATQFITLTVLISMLFSALSATRPAHAATHLTLWHSWLGDRAALLDQWIAAYQKKNDLVVIDAKYVPVFDLLPTLMSPATVVRPDLILGPSDWAGPLYANARVAALDVHLSADIRAQVIPAAWQITTYNNKIVGVPVDIEGVALYYNNALVDPKQLPTTYDGLLTQSKALTKGDQVGLILSKDFYPTAGMLLAFGSQLLDAQGNNALTATANSSLTHYLTILKALWAYNKDNALALDSVSDAFTQGKAAFLIDGNWALTNYRTALGDRLGVMTLPTIEGKPWTPFVRANVLYLSASNGQFDTSLDFAQYITSADGQQTAVKMVGAVPVNSSVPDSLDPLVAQFKKQLYGSAVAVPNRAEMSVYWPILSRAIIAVTADGRDVATVANETVTALNAAIDQLHNPNAPTATPTDSATGNQ